MEYLDVTDERGNPTGQCKARNAVHRDGDWHKAVHVWILSPSNELLVQRRSPIKESSPNMWDVSLAGHLSAGETSIEAAIKEAREELGQHFGAEDFEYLYSVAQKSVHQEGRYFDNEINDVYLVRAEIPVEQIMLREEEVAEVRYLPLEILRQGIESDDPTFVAHPEAYARLFDAIEKVEGRGVAPTPVAAPS